MVPDRQRRPHREARSEEIVQHACSCWRQAEAAQLRAQAEGASAHTTELRAQLHALQAQAARAEELQQQVRAQAAM